jgi:hypothetical protein
MTITPESHYAPSQIFDMLLSDNFKYRNISETELYLVEMKNKHMSFMGLAIPNLTAHNQEIDYVFIPNSVVFVVVVVESISSKFTRFLIILF